MVRICTVVIGKTLEEFLENLEKVQIVADFVELRVDYIENLRVGDLEIIKENTYKNNIFTCRTKESGGNYEDNEFFDIIYKANELGFDYIDIELSKLNNIKFDKINSKIIGSYHNFKETPSYEDLYKIYEKIISHKFVNIAKLATNVIKDDDNINLVKLILHKKTDIIVIGMGEKGKITRIVSPLIGGYLTFVSFKDCVSASGQLSLSELKSIFVYKD